MDAHELLGRFNALAEILETKINEAAAQQQNLAALSMELRQTGREIEDLRSIVCEFEGILKAYRPVEWMTTVQLAALLEVHENTIRNWYDRGIIPGYKIVDGGTIRFDRDEVSRAIKDRHGETICSRL